jgi:hypothetical protein
VDCNIQSMRSALAMEHSGDEGNLDIDVNDDDGVDGDSPDNGSDKDSDASTWEDDTASGYENEEEETDEYEATSKSSRSQKRRQGRDTTFLPRNRVPLLLQQHWIARVVAIAATVLTYPSISGSTSPGGISAIVSRSVFTASPYEPSLSTSTRTQPFAQLPENCQSHILPWSKLGGSLRSNRSA